MTEQELKRILGAQVALPEEVEQSMKNAYDQTRNRVADRKGRRSAHRRLRTILVAAAVVAALCASAAGCYIILRGEKPAEQGTALEALFGSQRLPSVQPPEEEQYDENGRLIGSLPNVERVPVDVGEAMALLEDYLPETGYLWELDGGYTLTVESYLLDEDTGTAKLYCALSHPGGVEGMDIWPENAQVEPDGTGVALGYTIQVDGEKNYPGYRTYADLERSTEDTLYMAVSLAGPNGLDAAEGLYLRFINYSHDGEKSTAVVELPGLKSLPAVSITDPDSGEEVLRFSAIGMLLHIEDADEIRYVALEYADGSQYVVEDKAANVANTDYALISGSRPEQDLRLCFNRLVDPARVVKVVIDGAEYPIN